MKPDRIAEEARANGAVTLALLQQAAEPKPGEFMFPHADRLGSLIRSREDAMMLFDSAIGLALRYGLCPHLLKDHDDVMLWHATRNAILQRNAIASSLLVEVAVSLDTITKECSRSMTPMLWQVSGIIDTLLGAVSYYLHEDTQHDGRIAHAQ